MFALWEWKCSTSVELLVTGAVNGGRMTELVLETTGGYIEVGGSDDTKCFACDRGKRLKCAHERAHPQNRNLITFQSGNRANEINPVSSVRYYKMARHRLRRFSQWLVE
jgi:hypothetical protein